MSAILSCPRQSSVSRLQRFVSVAIYLAALAIGLTGQATAQSSLPQNDYLERVGRPNFSVQDPMEYGFVNLANGTLHLEIPIADYPQRGGNKVAVKLMYDSRIYKRNWSAGTFFWDVDQVLFPWAGWRLVVTPSTRQLDYGTNMQGCYLGQDFYGTIFYFGPWTWTASDGTTKKFDVTSSIADDGGDCSHWIIPDATGYASDGSGYSISINNYTDATIYDDKGNQVYRSVDGAPQEAFKDTNGNFSSYNSSFDVIDELGRQLVITSTNGNLTYYDVLTSDGSRARYTATTSAINVHTAFYAPYVSEYAGTLTTVQSLSLPNGSSFSFGYDSGTNPGNFGLLTSMTLPTGGVVQFGYTTFVDAQCERNRWVSQRTSGGGTWGYAPSVLATNLHCLTNMSHDGTQQMVASRPSGDSRTYTFDVPDDFGAWNTATVFRDSAGNSVKSEAREYWPAIGTYVWYTDQRLPSRLTTTLPTQSGDISAKTEYSYDNWYFGNVTEVREWDYYSGAAPSTPTRVTDATYLASTSTYAAKNILSKPTIIALKDGNGNTVAQTQFEYDYYQDGIVGVGAVQHDSTFDTGFGLRGNVTAISKWRNTDSTWLTERNTRFDDAGNILKSTDPGGHLTQFGYAADWSYGNASCAPTGGNPAAYVTSVTNALNQTSHTSFNSCTGTIASTTDLNGDVTHHTYDSMGRVTSTSFPDGGQTTYYYQDPNHTQTRRLSDGTHWIDNWTEYDGFGRTVRAATSNGQANNWWDETVSCYDTTGRLSYLAYPFQDNGWSYAQNCNFAGDHFYYDALDRSSQTQHADGSTVDTAYSGRATHVTAESNGSMRVQTVSQSDAFGRLRSVCEVSSNALVGSGGSPVACNQDIGKTGFLTAYDYDLLGNLTAVHQNGLSDRTFQYDSLTELTYSWNPESGPTWYAYDNDGLASSRTRPAPNQHDVNTHVITYYGYEPLHRVLSRSYTDATRPVSFTYDETSRWGSSIPNGIGHQTSAWTTTWDGASIGSFAWNYDQMGRLKRQGMCTPRTCGVSAYDLYYNYNVLGQITSQYNGIQYNGVDVWQYSNYDWYGRLRSVTSSLNNSTHPGTILNNIHYGPFGIDSRTLNNDRQSETRGYAQRGLLQSLSVPGVYNFSLGFASNGNIASSGDSVNAAWTYTYDAFNRLATAVSSDGRGCAETYDRFGNRWRQDTYNGMCPTPFLNFWGGNNRIDGPSWDYDAAGNLIYDLAHTYTYDAEGRIVAVDGGATARYDYDAAGNRARNNSLEFLYDIGGHAVTMLDRNSGGWMRGEVYVGDEHVATYNNSTTYFNYSDWLGTERAQQETNSAALYETWQSYPFGESWSSVGANPLHFTGKERDAETDLDYFGARYYGSRIGRWLSADWSATPEAVPYADLADPPTLNLYGYVRSNPLSNRDADGHCPWCIGALIGAAVGAAIETGLELHRGGDLSLQKIGAAALGGAIAGGTLGLASEAGVGVAILAGTVGNTAGGVVERGVATGDPVKALDGKKMAVDAISGGVGGAAAKGGARLGQMLAGSQELGTVTEKLGQSKLGARHAARLLQQQKALETSVKGGGRVGEVVTPESVNAAKKVIEQKAEEKKNPCAEKACNSGS